MPPPAAQPEGCCAAADTAGFEADEGREKDAPLAIVAGASVDAASKRESQPPDVLLTVMHADECDAHGRLSLHAAFRYFERGRSTLIGGPDVVAEVLTRKLSLVVGRAGQVRLYSDTKGFGACAPGAELAVRSTLEMRARDTQVLFEQWLLPVGGGEPLAFARVTIVLIDVDRVEHGLETPPLTLHPLPSSPTPPPILPSSTPPCPPILPYSPTPPFPYSPRCPPPSSRTPLPPPPYPPP